VSDTLTGSSDPAADVPLLETVSAVDAFDGTVSVNCPGPVPPPDGIVTDTDSLPDPSGVPPPDDGLTVYDCAADVDAANAVESFGVNTAVSECDPSASDVETVAVPDEPTVADPTSVDPSLKSTVPAGTVVPDAADTFPDSVSCVPCAAGEAGDTVSDVDVPAGDDVEDENDQVGDDDAAPLNVTVLNQTTSMPDSLELRHRSTTLKEAALARKLVGTLLEKSIEGIVAPIDAPRRPPSCPRESLVSGITSPGSGGL
jgi:hypothetical protein